MVRATEAVDAAQPLGLEEGEDEAAAAARRTKAIIAQMAMQPSDFASDEARLDPERRDRESSPVALVQ